MFLNSQYLDKRLFVQLNGSRKVIGVLRGYDVRLPVPSSLSDTLPSPTLHARYPRCFVLSPLPYNPYIYLVHSVFGIQPAGQSLQTTDIIHACVFACYRSS